MRYPENPLEEIFTETDQLEGNFGEFDLEEQEYESWEQEGPPAGSAATVLNTSVGFRVP